MTLDRLADEYYKDFDLKKPAVEFAKYDGADTIKIAVTGDRPPIDLITADGKATGFNTAILAEIGKIMGNRDHTTVIHGHDKIEQTLSTDLKLKNEIEEICKKVFPS